MKRICITLLITAFLSIFSIPSISFGSAKISLSNFIQPTYANITCPAVGHNSGDCHIMKSEAAFGGGIRWYCEWTGCQADHCNGLTESLLNLAGALGS